MTPFYYRVASLGLLLLLILVTVVDALRHNQNTIFRRIEEITITKSKWLIALTIDLRPYELLLKKIESELVETATAGKRVEKDCIGNDKENCLNLWYPLMEEIKVMEEKWEIMEEYLKGLRLFESKTLFSNSYNREALKRTLWYRNGGRVGNNLG